MHTVDAAICYIVAMSRRRPSTQNMHSLFTPALVVLVAHAAPAAGISATLTLAGAIADVAGLAGSVERDDFVANFQSDVAAVLSVKINGALIYSWPTYQWGSMVAHGPGYCQNPGYYAGAVTGDLQGSESQEACNEVCMAEPRCHFATYAATALGKTCSRYSAASCDLNNP